MNIDIKDTVTLEDNIEYVVAGKVNYQEKNYYYLVATEDSSNLKFCSLKDETSNILIISEDTELNKNLLPLFSDQAEVLINEITESQ